MPLQQGLQFAFDSVQITVGRGEAYSVTDPGDVTAWVDVLIGLAPAGGATVIVDGTDVTELPPGRRGIGFVPTGGGLFPHLTVRDNIEYGWRAGMGRRAPAGRVTRLARELQVSGGLHLPAADLSSDQRMRVALARTLCLPERPVAVVFEDRGKRATCWNAVGAAMRRDLAVLVFSRDTAVPDWVGP